MPRKRKRVCCRGHLRTQDNLERRHCKKCRRIRLLEYSRSDAGRERKLRHTFGITLANYTEMFDAQGGVCAICGDPPGSKRLAVDHNHKTQRIRGLLCCVGWKKNCNYILGLLERRPNCLAISGKFAEYAASEGRWPWFVPEKKKRKRKGRK